MTQIKAIKTTVNGITFRSRLEASWYLYFLELGFEPEYEPDVFEVNKSLGGVMGNYVPDFFLRRTKQYVEIKPDMPEFSDRDKGSIGRACVLGYTHPTILIIGPIFKYFALEISEKRKGSPSGHRVIFDHDAEIFRDGPCDISSYCPDEGGGFVDPRTTCGEARKTWHDDLAGECWTKTAWKM